MNKDIAIKMDRDLRGKIRVTIDEELDGITYIVGVMSGFHYCSPSDPHKWIQDHSEYEGA